MPPAISWTIISIPQAEPVTALVQTITYYTIVAGNNVIYHYYGNPTAVNGTVAAQFSEATFTPSSGPTAASEEKSQGPVSYWKFDEGYGTSTQDSSGNANTGTLNDGSTWNQGKFGKGIKLDGTNDDVSVNDFSY